MQAPLSPDRGNRDSLDGRGSRSARPARRKAKLRQPVGDFKVLPNFPFSEQDYDFDCGPEALRVVLRYFKRRVSLPELTERLKSTREDGTNPTEIIKEIVRRKLHFKCGTMTIDDVKRAINSDLPVILVLQAWSINPEASEGHYVVAIGHGQGKVVFEDPEQDEWIVIEEKELLDRWYDKDSEGNDYIHFGIIVSDDEIEERDEIA